MEKTQLLNNIKAKYPGVEEFIPKEGSYKGDILTLIVPKATILDLCKELKNNSEYSFDYLMCLSGVDYKDHFEVVYHLYSMRLKHKLVVKVSVDRNNPEIESVVSVWETANWHEREAYDMFGIIFKNHPDLRRILLPSDWEGYPLRKDYARKPDQYD